jgi:hypothetical protein
MGSPSESTLRLGVSALKVLNLTAEHAEPQRYRRNLIVFLPGHRYKDPAPNNEPFLNDTSTKVIEAVPELYQPPRAN